MKTRIKYDAKFGFKITPETDVPKLLSVLSQALEQPVELESSCFICERLLGDEEKAGAVICSECKKKEDAYALYTMKFASLAENI